MRGLLLDGGPPVFCADLPEPVPGPGEVVVDVLRAGVCATDLALARGYMGFRGVPGHEFVGVARSGPLAGRRVVGEINAACGACPTCAAGRPRHCPHRTVLGILGRNGAFAERLCLPPANLHAVPDGVTTDAATFCEPLAAALAIGAQTALVAGQRALVAGDGKLGLLCAAVLGEAGLEVTIAGRHPERAALVPGAVHRAGWLEPGGSPPPAAYDLAVEATGDAGVLPRLLPAVRPRGTIVLKTTTERPTALDLAPLVVDEITLVGSRCGAFQPALDALAAGRIDVAALIAARYPLARGADAIAHAARPGTLKVLLEVGAGSG